MARADFITALVLIVLGLGVVEESWRMPRFTEFGSSIWSAPGIVPGLIGMCLAVMGAVLLARARREKAAVAETGETVHDSAGWRRVAVAFGFCILFAGILVGRVPFLVAAFVFMSLFMVVFDIQENPEILADRKRLVIRAAIAVAIAAIASFAIATIFQDVFFVRLP